GHCKAPSKVDRGPQRWEIPVKPGHRRLVRDIDAAHDVDAWIACIREVVEFGGDEVGYVTDRVSGAQCADDGSPEGACSAGDDNVTAYEIDHCPVPLVFRCGSRGRRQREQPP